ncbi:MAG: type I-C CRISPR-associated protein Cas8c/Csd1 [Eubacteriales bacterium]|nr:type I-C CRISPR-associated protein Cas8c/Csd1 [Eubacteriales bacterium]
MNWIRELCDLYEKNEQEAGKMTEGRYGEPLVLLPIFHSTVQAQITVTLNPEGDFLRAERVQEEDKTTIIPVTEKSAARTAGIEPHPLCDNLKYLAGDYMDYVVPDKEKNFSENHEKFMVDLEKWALSSYSHEKVQAIWRYLKKNSLMKDLISQGVLTVDGQGKVLKEEKIQKSSQADAFVRFRVEKKWDSSRSFLLNNQIEALPECWKDSSLQNRYIDYCRNMDRAQGLSYLTGEQVQIAYLHPKKIRNEGDGAKLISANDETNFTFRGRFVNKEEAFSVGYEDSQKAHNALKWIIRKQGRTWNGLTVVIWESDLRELPEWSMDTDQVCDVYESTDSWGDEEDPEGLYSGTNPREAVRFLNAIEGYRQKLDAGSRMILMAFDAATTGRLAMMESRSLMSSAYLKNLESWYTGCGWIQTKFKNKAFYQYYGMISVKDVANILYGVESKGELTLKGANDKMYAEVCKRLIPCIIYGRKIPDDMVRLAVKKASSPVSYEKPYNWERALALACSLVKKKSIERKESEVWTVALNKESQERSYLFGRLLAVADCMEYRTFERDANGKITENRLTSARRLMNAFSQQPFRTWKLIEERIQPYYAKLSIQDQLFYSHLIEEICWRFKEGDFEKNDSLNGLYLLGFHNQVYALRNKVEED